MPYVNLLQKHVSQKVFLVEDRKKKLRQYLLSVAFYERSLLIVREIFFFFFESLADSKEEIICLL